MSAVNGLNSPPLVPGTPILGSVIAMSRDPLRFLIDQYKQMGPIFRVKALHKRITVLAGAEANIFLSNKGNECLSGKEIWAPMMSTVAKGGRSLLDTDGKEHIRLRKIWQPGFVPTLLTRRLPMMASITESLLQHWQVGQNINVIRFMQRLVSEQLGIILAKRPAGDYINDLVYLVHTLIDVFITKRKPKLILYMPAFKRAKKRTLQLAKEVIREHQQSNSQVVPDFIDSLLETHQKDKAFFTHPDLLIAALAPFFGGVDTVANTCSFMIYALLKNPEVLEKVTAESDAIFKEDTLSMQSLRKMPTLYGATMETLRMYPVARMLQRKALHPFEFKGSQINKGDDIIMGTSVTHFLPHFFPDPYKFDPERYHPPRNEHRQKGVFAPYGFGAHRCIGAQIAETQIMLSMAILLHKTRLEFAQPDYELKQIVTPVPSPELNFEVRLKEWRSQNASLAK